MPTVLITGANRGIGLELARAYAGDGWTVIGACRNPDAAVDLAAIDGVDLCPLDVTDTASIAAMAERYRGRPIDVLLNNAGIIGGRGMLAEIDYAAWADAMETNLFGPIRIAEAMKDNVLSSDRKQMAFISSKMASIAECTGGSYIYRSSKTALNMAVKCLSLEFAANGLTAVMFHPGHVRTDMGGAAAPVLPVDSANGIKSVIDGLSPADNGRFFNFDGAELPW
ncbi:SDR family oxidoreductase [Nisaea sp.]|uniref:SDR family oxidoreductase n=1 Tax=Nisaea sp. TaxID=2024842 RepID=UPI0032F07D4E